MYKIRSFFAIKGMYGYIRKKKRNVTLYTILLFALSLAIFFVGYYTTGRRANLLTVVAVLGCLPASKSAVNMIMFLKAKACPREVYDRITECAGELMVYYDLQFTAYERTYQVDSLVHVGHSVIGYSSNPKMKTEQCEKHIKDNLDKNHFKDYTVKIFNNLDKYTERVKQLAQTEELEQPGAAYELLLSMAL